MSYIKMSDKEYHQLPHLSQSKLKKLIGLEWKQYQVALNKPYTSDSLRLGKIAHELNLLTKDLSDVLKLDKLDGRTAAGKEQAKSLDAIDQWMWSSEVEMFEKMKQNFEESGEAQAILKSSTNIEEVGLIQIADLVNPDKPIDFKFKPDMVGSDFMADYKTIGDFASAENCRIALRKYKYNFQAACYSAAHQVLTGQAIKDFYIIFQETVEPYGVRVVKVPQHELDYGLDLFDATLKKYMKCVNDESKQKANYSGITEILINEI